MSIITNLQCSFFVFVLLSMSLGIMQLFIILWTEDDPLTVTILRQLRLTCIAITLTCCLLFMICLFEGLQNAQFCFNLRKSETVPPTSLLTVLHHLLVINR